MTSVLHVAKRAATGLGGALCLVETWMNSAYVAQTEGWASPYVVGTLVASVCAAAALPIAEQAWKTGETFKASGLAIFFLIMVIFSFGTSAARTGGKVDGDVSATLAGNRRAELASEALLAAKKAEKDECARVIGTACRKARTTLETARAAAMAAPATKTVDSGSQRIAALLGIQEATVQQYMPLALPLAFQLGGFLLLAFGLSPMKPEPDIRVEPLAEAETVKITSKEAAYRWWVAQVMKSPRRELTRSGRSMAVEIGVAEATFAKWAKDWVAEGKAVSRRSGNQTVWTLPRIKAVRAA